MEAAQEETKDKERRVHDELGKQAALVKRCKKEVRKENAAEVAEAQEVEMQRALDDAQYRATPQDSLDRLLDLIRSHNAQGRRNRWILVASIASMLAARAIWKLYLSDVDAPALVFGGSQDWKLAALVWPVAWIPIVALAHWRSHALRSSAAR